MTTAILNTTTTYTLSPQGGDLVVVGGGSTRVCIRLHLVGGRAIVSRGQGGKVSLTADAFTQNIIPPSSRSSTAMNTYLHHSLVFLDADHENEK